jgi:hypothetical protein
MTTNQTNISTRLGTIRVIRYRWSNSLVFAFRKEPLKCLFMSTTVTNVNMNLRNWC